MQIRYALVDAFTERPPGGSPVAIVPHAETLDEPTMRRIAGELNQVATTFILPPKNDFADWRLRSFTTDGHEVFGAGHNSLGAWWWLAKSGDLMLDEGRNHFMQEIGGELLPVEVRCQHSQPVTVALTHMSPVYGAVCEDFPKLANALGVEDEDIMLSLPAQVVSTGVAHLLVPVIDREIVAKAQPDPQQLKRLLQEVDGEGCYLYCLDDSEFPSSVAHARFFNSAQGIVEEAATATAAVPLAGFMLRYGIAGNRKTLFIEQGYEMKRPCVLEVEIEDDVLRLAGRAITVMEGMLHL
ncbi:PhzF family phenazine biosynthesis protein [Granulicella mallensis]|uniref:Phenazine biosynthesis protein PhzF family n=1 Tax=Granulicella mallensis (strain ATCC BAA-1857 / DSM 23137 / MP5ACTX8) TaxID=682795 RepID=G8P127_GRAMM|nr:PhzF family phenazine biosynthesis protein [Granulicella mallensis]AEU36951.1 phenazine biosynthesis protein PhzF family [Granulicella mallensis MP5ACTX8]